jgi:hypothetical protein
MRMSISPATIEIAEIICEYLDALDRAIEILDYQKYCAVVRRGIESLFNQEGK